MISTRSMLLATILETAILIIVLGVTAASAAAGPQKVGPALEWGPGGLTQLRYDGTELLSDGAIKVNRIVLEKTDGTLVPGDVQPDETRSDRRHHTMVDIYRWGVVTGEYSTEGSKVNVTLTITNRSASTIDSLDLRVMTFAFPEMPTGYDDGIPRLAHNVGRPGFTEASYGHDRLVVCNEDVGRPLMVGFPFATDPPSKRDYPLVVASRNIIAGLSPYLDPYMHRPIPPGSSDVYHLSLRFSPASVPTPVVVSDLNRKFAIAYPFEQTWSDHRPIGQLNISSVAAQHKSKTNPRGWLQDPTIDVATPEGRARFKQRMLAYAEESVRILRQMNAQGMIVWDSEGQEYPHATSYIGDPRSLPPEMDDMIGPFFQKFRDAGLLTGVCLRPTLPVRATYTDAVVWQQDVADPVALLNAKIAYARSHWGCTIYYIDSNGDPNAPFDALMFKRLHDANPDVLLVPEHSNALYHAYTTPYHELRQGFARTPAAVRDIYPGAFELICVDDGPIDKRWNDLVSGVKQGDILLFRAWFDSTENTKVAQIYAEARKP